MHKPQDTTMSNFPEYVTQSFRNGLAAAGIIAEQSDYTLNGNITGFLAKWKETNAIIVTQWSLDSDPLKIDMVLTDKTGSTVWTKTITGSFAGGELRKYAAFSYNGYVSGVTKEAVKRAVTSLLRDDKFIAVLTEKSN
jgi:hypothetical protein